MSTFSSLSVFGQTFIPLLLFAEAVLELGLFLYQMIRSKQPLRSLPCAVHFAILLTLLFSVTQGDPDEGNDAFLTGSPWILFAAVIVLVAIHFAIALPREYRRRKNELSPFSIKEGHRQTAYGHWLCRSGRSHHSLQQKPDSKAKTAWERENVVQAIVKTNRNQDPELFAILKNAESNQREPKTKSRSRDNRGRFSFSAPRPSSIRRAGCPASRQFPAGRCSSCCSSSGKCQQSEVFPILHLRLRKARRKRRVVPAAPSRKNRRYSSVSNPAKPALLRSTVPKAYADAQDTDAPFQPPAACAAGVLRI